MARPSIFRKKYLIDKPNQLKFMLLIIMYLIIYTELIYLIIFSPSIKVLISNTAPLIERFEAGQQFLFLASRVWPAIIITISIIGVHSIFITHKIFGPLYRLKVIFQDMAKGNLPTNIKLRKRDYIKDCAEKLNKCNSAIKSKIIDIAKGEQEVSNMIDEIIMLQSDKKIASESLVKMINDLKQKHEDINALLEFFKVKD